MSLLTPSAEIRVNTTTASDQHDSSVTGLSDGGYVVTWMSLSQDGSGYGVYAQRYDATGNTVGSETRVNTTTASHQEFPTVAALSDGGYIVTWMSRSQDGSAFDLSSQNGSAFDIYAQRYDANGNTVGSETLVNTTTANQQFYPWVTGLSDGGYIVTWMSRSQDGSAFDLSSQNGSDHDIYAQRFDAAGNTAGSETRVNTTTAGGQYQSTVAALSDGGYVVTWGAPSQDGFGSGVDAQRYDATGNTVGSEIHVNTTTAGDTIPRPKVAALSDRGYVVTWNSLSQDGSGYGVYAQRYDATGSTVGSESHVNTTTAGDQLYPSVAALSDGGYVVAWMSNPQDGSGVGIYAQQYDQLGNAVGGETPVNTTTAGDQVWPYVSALSDGGYIVTWTSLSQDGSGYGVYSRAFAVINEAPAGVALTNTTVSVLENTSTASHIKVADITITDDALGTNTLALTGTDATFFEIVGMELFLKAGTVLDFESKTSYAVAVTVDDPTVGVTPDATSTTYTLNVSNVSGGTVTGTNQADVIDATHTVAGQPLPTNEEDTIDAGGGKDTINALGGNDFINGGAGADKMLGGTGNDTYVVDNSGDIVNETGGNGLDTVQSSITFDLSDAVHAIGAIENLTLTGIAKINGTGNALANDIVGNSGNNILNGLGGADILTGGQGSDKFVFTALAHSTPSASDIITDFVTGSDIIDLSTIDANTSKGGNQAFAFGGHNANVVANSVTWVESNENTIVQADANGDTTADLQIVLLGTNLNLHVTDFIL